MDKNLISKIKSEYETMTISEKRISDFILNNLEEAKSLSISEFAEITNTSISSVSRYCKNLGFKNFQDMKISLNISDIKNNDSFFSSITFDNTYNDILKYTFYNGIKSLHDTQNFINPENLEKAITILSNSKNCVLFGVGGSSIVTMNAYHRFIRTSINCIFNADYHMQLMYAGKMKSNDCALIVSHSGKNKDILRIIDILKTKNIKIISITSNASSPIAKLSDVVFVSISEETKYIPEAFSSMVSQFMIIDCLFTAYAVKNDNEPYFFADMRKVINSTRI